MNICDKCKMEEIKTLTPEEEEELGVPTEEEIDELEKIDDEVSG